MAPVFAFGYAEARKGRNGKSKSYKHSNCLAKTNDVSNKFFNFYRKKGFLEMIKQDITEQTAFYLFLLFRKHFYMLFGSKFHCIILDMLGRIDILFFYKMNFK